MKVFSGTKSRYLAEKICENLGCSLGNVSITYFADGEFEVCYEESIRGCDVFLVQSTFPSTDNLMELLLMVDAAKRLKQYNIPSLSITGNVDKRLLNLTDYNFQIMITENTFELSPEVYTLIGQKN